MPYYTPGNALESSVGVVPGRTRSVRRLRLLLIQIPCKSSANCHRIKTTRFRSSEAICRVSGLLPARVLVPSEMWSPYTKSWHKANISNSNSRHPCYFHGQLLTIPTEAYTLSGPSRSSPTISRQVSTGRPRCPPPTRKLTSNALERWAIAGSSSPWLACTARRSSLRVSRSNTLCVVCVRMASSSKSLRWRKVAMLSRMSHLKLTQFTYRETNRLLQASEVVWR